MGPVTVDRSIDGARVPVFEAHFEGLLSAKEDGEYRVVLNFVNEAGKSPLAICPICATGLLQCLQRLKEMSPEHFAS